MAKEPQLLEGGQSLWEHGWLGEGEEGGSRGLELAIFERDFCYVVYFILGEQTGDIRWSGGAGKTREPDMDIRVALRK